MPWKITVKNYRSFSEEKPIVIDLSQPVTALVGPNNSGKSSVLKFFWEFRSLLATAPKSLLIKTVESSAKSQSRIVIPSGLQSTSAAHAVFSTSNTRPIQIEMQYLQDSTRLGETIPKWLTNACPLHLRLEVNQDQNVELILLQNGKPQLFNLQNLSLSSEGDFFCYKLKDGDGDREYYFDQIGLLEFSNCILIPAHRTVSNIAINQTFNLLFGSGAVTAWNTYKRSEELDKRRIASKIETELKTFFDFRDLDISTTLNDSDFIIKIDREKTYLLKDMGSGFGQLFAILLNLQNTFSKIVLIDEPEIGLHPKLQQQFIKTISKVSNGPVIFATHSLGLARATADSVISLKVLNEHAHFSAFEASKHQLELLGEMSFASWKDVGCDGVLFVEGPHDVRVFSEWMRILGIAKNWAVLPLGGSTTIDAMAAEAIGQASRVHPRVAVIIDSEKQSENAVIEQKRQHFLGGCAKAGIMCHATKLRAADNYLTERAIRIVVGAKGLALTPYEKLGSHNWGKSHSQKIAAEMTREEVEANDVGEFLMSLSG
jgi:predicted ATP-dependent endonuclease of OLD family